MKTSSWKHQLAVASFLAVFVELVVRLLVADYVMTSGPTTTFFIAGFVILVAFFLPLIWWRTTVGYIAGIIFGLFSVVTSIVALITLVSPGEIPAEAVSILYPAIIFGLLLIAGSVLAWRED